MTWPWHSAHIDATRQRTAAERPVREGVRVLDFHGELANASGASLVSGRVFAASEPCAYFHTGGTTGYPKVAVHTHLNEAFLAWVSESFYESDNVLLGGLPLFHVNGALITGLAAFHCGFEIVMLTPAAFAQRVSSITCGHSCNDSAPPDFRPCRPSWPRWPTARFRLAACRRCGT